MEHDVPDGWAARRTDFDNTPFSGYACRTCIA